jgi:hypothetical protein
LKAQLSAFQLHGTRLQPHLPPPLSQRRQQPQVSLQLRQVGVRYRLLSGTAATAAAALLPWLQRLRAPLQYRLGLRVL